MAGGAQPSRHASTPGFESAPAPSSALTYLLPQSQEATGPEGILRRSPSPSRRSGIISTDRDEAIRQSNGYNSPRQDSDYNQRDNTKDADICYPAYCNKEQSEDELSCASPSTLRLDSSSPQVRQRNNIEDADQGEDDTRPLQRKRCNPSSALPSALRLDGSSPQVRQRHSTEDAGQGEDDIRPSETKRRKLNSATPPTLRLDNTTSPQVSQRDRTEDADSSRDQGEDDMRLLQPKRRKLQSAVQAISGTSLQVRRSARGRKPRNSSPNPSSLHTHRRDEIAEAPVAEFGEWPLDNAVLKRIIVDNQATFQIQFTWDCCVDNKRGGQYPLDSRDEEASASTQIGQSQYLPPTGKSRSPKTRRRRASQPTGKQPRGKGPGYVVKTDTEGNPYDAWKFKCILDSRQCSNASDEIEYKIKWIGPWRVTWQPALDLQDNLEEITEFHRRMPDKPGPPGWVEEAIEKDASQHTAHKRQSTRTSTGTSTSLKSDSRVRNSRRRRSVAIDV